ncbi:isoprenoid synthase domain-containing protein [Apiospora arundinis]
METGTLTETAVLPAPPPLTLSFQPIFPYNDKLPTTLDVPSFTVIPPLDERQIHPQEILDEVNVVFDEWLKTVFYTYCSKEKLITLTKYNYWIFMFDDEINPGGDLTADDTGTRRICDQTLQCIDACLHPDPCLAASFTTIPPPNSPGTVEMLYEILSVMHADMGPSTVERLRHQLHEYFEGVARQQSVKQDDRLPDPWHHLKLRCDDIGVRPSVTQIEYAMGLELPDRAVLGCAQLCVLVNEILSLEKEFRAGQLENLCLLFVNAENITIHAAISKVKALIRKRYRSCEDAIARLPWSDDEQVNDNIRQGRN